MKRKTSYILLPVGLTLGVTLAFGLNSMAEDSELDSEPRVVPYNGVLDFDGQAFVGNADFEFTLTDDDSCNFTEEHDDVAVVGGRFAANIGSKTGAGVPDCVFDATAMYIQIGVRPGAQSGAYTALAGRQRIRPVPFAYWAAEGADFRVDGGANIGGGLSTGGDIEGGRDITATRDVVGRDFKPSRNVIADGQITGQQLNSRSGINASGTITTNGNLDVDGEVVFGNGRPPSGSSMLTFSRASAGSLDGSDDIDNMNDFQIALYPSSNAPEETYGIGVGSNTFFTNSNNEYRFMRKGDTVLKIEAAETRFHSRILRKVYDNQPSNSSAAITVSGNKLYLTRNICMITSVNTINENNDRCRLDTASDGGGDYWTYDARDADCNVMCFKWN